MTAARKVVMMPRSALSIDPSEDARKIEDRRIRALTLLKALIRRRRSPALALFLDSAAEQIDEAMACAQAIEVRDRIAREYIAQRSQRPGRSEASS